MRVLRETFAANVQRVPESRIKPLSVIASRDGKVAWMGPLDGVVGTALPAGLAADRWQVSTMADLTVRRSTDVDLELGLTVLEGFLAGFGVHNPEISTQFRGASTVSFSFSDIVRTYIEPTALGQALVTARVDPAVPSNAIFFGSKPWRLNVVDSIIASSDFSVAVTEARDDAFSLQVPVIQTLVGDARLRVSGSGASAREVTFHGPERLTFAYSCVRFHLTEDGRVATIAPGSEVRGPAGQPVVQPPARKLLSNRPGLMEWDPID